MTERVERALREYGLDGSGLAEQMRQHVPSGWQDVAASGDWLEAAKLALRDRGASSSAALVCATIALTEQLRKEVA